MDIIYIILVHKNPEQVSRLVNRLRSDKCFFYIHVDKKVAIDDFRGSLSSRVNLNFVNKREDGKWGGLGIVKAVLNAFGQILADNRVGYCVLLSGQDYPIKSNKEIREFLENSNGCSFADTWALPAEHWYNGGLDRIHHYKFDVTDGNRNYVLVPSAFSREFRSEWRRNLKNVIRLVKQGKSPFRIIQKRNFPGYLRPFGGSQWFGITTETVAQILQFLKANHNYLAYHKHTLLADEIFFQSLIERFSFLGKTPSKPSLTYLRWENKEAAHPVTFSSDQLDELKEASYFFSGKLFARKFNPNDAILSLIDNLLNQREYLSEDNDPKN